MRFSLEQLRAINPELARALTTQTRQSRDRLQERIAAASGSPVITGNRYEVQLASLLVQHYRHWNDGGEVVQELVPLSTAGYRLDCALPRYRIGVEIDGFRDHGASIKGFQRDRLKSLLLTANGWHIIPLTTGQITSSPDLIIRAIDTIIERTPADRTTRLRFSPRHCYLES